MLRRLLVLPAVVTAAVTVGGIASAAAPVPVTWTGTAFTPSTVMLTAVGPGVDGEARIALTNASSAPATFCIDAVHACNDLASEPQIWSFGVAATYVMRVQERPGPQLTLGVPIAVESAVGLRADLRWATQPLGFARTRVDVEWHGPGPARWARLASATSSPTGTFVAPHPGRYAVRARGCDTWDDGTVTCTAWSPETTLRLAKH